MITVDKGIPIPLNTIGKYPWRSMEIGDSFFIPGLDAKDASSAYGYQQLRYGTKYKAKGVEGGVRVWRVA